LTGPSTKSASVAHANFELPAPLKVS